MSLKKNIVWIASYPKSGNTWYRIFLSNLLSKSQKPINVNRLLSIPIASNRALFDEFAGVNSSDLTIDEINNLRPAFHQHLSRENNDVVYVKVHDAWTLNKRGEPIFPEAVTKGVIYIIRNPLDIAVSMAYHDVKKIPDAIQKLNSSYRILGSERNKLYYQFEQSVLCWSKHVTSWCDNSNLPVHILKYEDLLKLPYNTFKGSLSFLNLKYSVSEIQTAIKHSSFQSLKEQENIFGFKEKPIDADSFFASGKTGVWKRILNSDQICRIKSIHAEKMKKYSYLSEYE